MGAAFEREYLTRLRTSRRNIAKAARTAGLDRKSIYSLLKKHGMTLDEDDEDKAEEGK